MGMGANADLTHSGLAYQWAVFKFYIRDLTIKVQCSFFSQTLFKVMFLYSPPKIRIMAYGHLTQGDQGIGECVENAPEDDLKNREYSGLDSPSRI